MRPNSFDRRGNLQPTVSASMAAVSAVWIPMLSLLQLTHCSILHRQAPGKSTPLHLRLSSGRPTALPQAKAATIRLASQNSTLAFGSTGLTLTRSDQDIQYDD
ncbi:hypothetical protein PFLUV_G00182590 [Perca fluviatilis]|uniref:Uncharacterized protein n=1 Tax=Perca fluviatilis TaxID=8168 RepID=A0A6A5EVI2_PERFL|nr:hypothetical protein PFLUV_G00182590 [Perca fluviatilis]